jgi:hypothetical protein
MSRTQNGGNVITSDREADARDPERDAHSARRPSRESGHVGILTAQTRGNG